LLKKLIKLFFIEVVFFSFNHSFKLNKLYYE